MTDRYGAQALAAATGTFAMLSYEGWKERVRGFHISWGLPDEALRLGYALWLRRRNEEQKEVPS